MTPFNSHKIEGDSDKELFAKAAAGNRDATMILIQVRLADKLVQCIKKYYPTYSSEEVNDVLSEFMFHMIEPDKNGNWRLRNLDPEHNPEGYVYTAINRWILDRISKAKTKGEANGEVEESLGSVTDNIYDIDDSVPKSLKEIRVETLFEALTQLRDCTAEERYVFLTFLMGLQFKDRGDGQKPLKLRDHLAETLNITPTRVGRIHDKVLNHVIKTAKEILLYKTDPEAFKSI